MAKTAYQTDAILVLAIIAGGAFLVWKLFAGQDGAQGAGSSGTTALGNQYTVNADGSLTVNFRGATENYVLTATVGPNGQTMASLLGSGWNYGDVADMILMSQENLFTSNP